MHSAGRLFLPGLNQMRCGVVTTPLPGIMGFNRCRSDGSDDCFARIDKHTPGGPVPRRLGAGLRQFPLRPIVDYFSRSSIRSLMNF